MAAFCEATFWREKRERRGVFRFLAQTPGSHGPGAVREAQYTQKETRQFNRELQQQDWSLKLQHAAPRCNVAPPEGKGPLSPQTLAGSTLPERHAGSGMTHGGPGHAQTLDEDTDAPVVNISCIMRTLMAPKR